MRIVKRTKRAPSYCLCAPPNDHWGWIVWGNEGGELGSVGVYMESSSRFIAALYMWWCRIKAFRYALWIGPLLVIPQNWRKHQ